MTLRPSFLALTLLLTSSALPAADECCGIPDLPEPPAFKAARGVTLPGSAQDVSFAWPISATPELNSPYGPRRLGTTRYDWHRGIDLRLDMGTPLLAPADAVVVAAGTVPGFSDTIVQLRHNAQPPYVYTLYLHLLDVDVTAGDTVLAGEQIARSGQGTASYPHLHWEVRFGCLNQVCSENPYQWLSEPNAAPPAPPQLEAFGSGGPYGTMVLLSGSFPQTEIDFDGIEVSWGTVTRDANISELNGLTPSGAASRLDDPLFFFEEHAFPVVFFPKRYNLSRATADYDFLFFNLDGNASSGTATIADGGGLTALSNLTPVAPPLTLESLQSSLLVTPGATVTPRFRVTSQHTAALDLEFTGVSSQSRVLTATPSTATLAPGTSVTVDLSGELEEDWPQGTGDVILLRVEVDNGAYTDLLGASFIDTSDTASASDWWILD